MHHNAILNEWTSEHWIICQIFYLEKVKFKQDLINFAELGLQLYIPTNMNETMNEILRDSQIKTSINISAKYDHGAICG